MAIIASLIYPKIGGVLWQRILWSIAPRACLEAAQWARGRSLEPGRFWKTRWFGREKKWSLFPQSAGPFWLVAGFVSPLDDGGV
jgi:hypothetical protein